MYVLLAIIFLFERQGYLLNAWHACLAAGGVIWRLEYRNMASPAARLLVTGVNDPGSVIAFFGKVGRSPRVFAARDRDTLLRELQTAALKKMGMTVAGAGFAPNKVIMAAIGRLCSMQ